jgi:hypothetical protein
MSASLRVALFGRRLLTRSLLVWAVLFSAAFAGPSVVAGSTDPIGIAGANGAGRTKTPVGYDISYPQCGARFPSKPAFAIVGVNGGIVFSANRCLADELAWGGDAKAGVYINTGNPGPQLSSHWPTGATTPRVCSAANPDTADCAYDYGWNAASDSYATLAAGYVARGITASPSGATWWLDVETSNSWRDNVALNVAALQGEIDHLVSRGVLASRLGFYSTTAQWGTITGGTTAFAGYASWGAGAPNQSTALSHCVSTPGFTGGRLALVQYTSGGFDADVAC